MNTRKGAPRSQLLADDVARLLGQCRRDLWSAAARSMAGKRESAPSLHLLVHLGRAGALTQAQLAAETGQDAATVCRTLERLEKRGLVARRGDPDDKRRRLVETTATGRARAGEMTVALATECESYLAPLAQTERATLRDLLEKLVVARGGSR